MSRWATTRAGRGRVRQDERDRIDAERRASLQSNPQQIVENIFSRQSVCRSVASRMLFEAAQDCEHAVGTMHDRAVDFVAAQVGVPRETVLECLSIEALETGQ